jgi:peptidoglycan/xylan/chitin deacetylase (PgdA/CDA1 family)
MRWDTSDLLVLCYHAVSPSWPCDLAVTPPALERQLTRLLKAGYRGATFHDAVAAQPAHRRTLVVTFDDAFESVYRLARPILERLGLPATVFVPTGQAMGDRVMAWSGIDTWLGGPHESELSGMSGEQLRSLAAAGWEIGAHTRTHPCLPDLADPELEEELRGSKEDCERELGIPCVTLAYPYGAADARVRAAARASGFEAAAGLSRDLRDASPWYWPRVGVYRNDRRAHFALKVSAAIRRVRGQPGLARLTRHGEVEAQT